MRVRTGMERRGGGGAGLEGRMQVESRCLSFEFASSGEQTDGKHEEARPLKNSPPPAVPLSAPCSEIRSGPLGKVSPICPGTAPLSRVARRVGTRNCAPLHAAAIMSTSASSASVAPACPAPSSTAAAAAAGAAGLGPSGGPAAVASPSSSSPAPSCKSSSSTSSSRAPASSDSSSWRRPCSGKSCSSTHVRKRSALRFASVSADSAGGSSSSSSPPSWLGGGRSRRM